MLIGIVPHYFNSSDVQRCVIVGDVLLCPGTVQSFFSYIFDALREHIAVCIQAAGLSMADCEGPFAALHPAFPKSLYARAQTICAPTV